MAQRPRVLPFLAQEQDATRNPSDAAEQVEVLDARVNQLLVHIRADQLEKANLVAALADARAEVASLRDEVHLLRIGVQKLSEDRSNYHSADARLERPCQAHEPDPTPTRPRSSSRRQADKQAALENETRGLLSEAGVELGPEREKLTSARKDLLNHAQAVGLSHISEEPVRRPNSQRTSAPRTATEHHVSPPPPPAEADSIGELAKQLLGELALAMTFTRSVDSLVKNPVGDKHPAGSRKFRPDGEVFGASNLESLLCRLRVWKQLARREERVGGC